MGIYLILAHMEKGTWCGRVITPLWCLEAPVWQLKNGFSNSAQNVDSETIFAPFGLDGWLKVRYLLNYNRCRDTIAVGRVCASD